MKNIVKYLQWLDEEFKKHKWLEFLIKAMAWVDPDFDCNPDQIFDEIMIATLDMYQDDYDTIPIKEREADQEEFKRILVEDKDAIMLIYRIFNV